MTNGEICETAIRLAGETSASECPDYADRSESLLALICRSLAPLDRDIRDAKGLNAQGTIPDPALPEGTFPLTEELAPAAAFQLASLLTVDENASLSETMRSRFEEAIADVRARIPMKSGQTRDVYPGIL